MDQGTVDERLLDRLLGELEQARDWSPRLVSRLEALVRGEPRDLLRVNPVAFAAERSVEPAEGIDLFLHAARIGLFQMDWNIICPLCGLTVDSFSSLAAINARYHCGLCHAGADAHLDDFIQVSFTIAPAVRPIAFHDPESLDPETYFAEYRFSRDALLKGMGRPMGEVLREDASTHFIRLDPGETVRLSYAAEPPCLTGVDGRNHGEFLVRVAGEPTETVQRVSARYGGGRFEPAEHDVRPGPVEIEVLNAEPHPVPFIFTQVPEDDTADEPIIELAPFLNGAMLLANHTFRRLFRSEVIPADEGIGIREVTLLFTDLKGSTALYERIGDLQAFSLVREHFEHIERAVQGRSGAVVKTIGDAVMAVFLEPANAVLAALEMLETIDAFNTRHGRRDLVLKVGIHRGSSIAVTLNENLDYFGQTVNMAARVQGLADADEVWVTEAVWVAPGVQAIFDTGRVTPRDVRLKGIDKDVRVYCAARRVAAA